jgi:2-iminoacetate synthase ThiH
MMEENVVSASGTKKILAKEEELQESIFRSGFNPIKRDSDYNHLETLLLEKRDLVASVPIQN